MYILNKVYCYPLDTLCINKTLTIYISTDSIPNSVFVNQRSWLCTTKTLEGE